ncbi:hypothetical protein CPB83DRAFT_853736, partial [Crepidotus variabilis]
MNTGTSWSQRSFIERRIMLLPTELHDQIIDELGFTESENVGSASVDRRRTLAACLLVSHSFRNRSMRYLFNVVRLKGHQSHVLRRATLLNAILARESTLDKSSLLPTSHFIQEIVISPIGVDSRVNETGNSLATLLSTIRTRMEEGFGPKNLGLDFRRQNWSNIVPPFKEELLALIQSPYLNFLSIKRLVLVPPSFLHGLQIIGLSLQDVRFVTTETISVPLNLGNIHPPRLTRFECDGYIPGFVHTTFLDLICNKLFADLKILRWEAAEFDEKTNLKQILHSTANSLEELDIGIFSWQLNNTEGLGSMTKLQQLHLETECLATTVSNIANFFNIQVPLSRLHTIHFTFRKAHNTSSSREGQLPPGLIEQRNDCQLLDNHLSSLHYSNLKKVLVTVKLDWPAHWQNSSSVEEVRSSATAELRALFPRLAASPLTNTSFLPNVEVEL